MDSTRPREVSSSPRIGPELGQQGLPALPRAIGVIDRSHSIFDTNRSWLSTSSTTLPDERDGQHRDPDDIPPRSSDACEQDRPGDQQARRGHVDVARRGRLLGAELGPDEAGEEEERDARDQQGEHDRREPARPARCRRRAPAGRASPTTGSDRPDHTGGARARVRPARTRGRRRGWASASRPSASPRTSPARRDTGRPGAPARRAPAAGSAARWRPVPTRNARATPDVASAIVKQDRRDGRPARRDDDGGHPRRGRPDRPGLERPQDVVAARAEDEHDRHRAERPHRSSSRAGRRRRRSRRRRRAARR